LPIAAKFRAFGWKYRQIDRNIDTEPFKSVGLVAGRNPEHQEPVRHRLRRFQEFP
jgi:hypothetical protein